MKDIAESDSCEVVCTDNNRTAIGEILSFRDHKALTVSLDRAVKLTLIWNGQHYAGSMGGLSFTSIGPDIRQYTIK